ncbi:hypothetical protein ACIOZM_31820, partial [Pseudomonas sp. NPDC087346]
TATVTSNATNLISNGSFTGGATGWNTSGTVYLHGNGHMTFEGGPKPDGLGGVIQQNVTTVVGETYVVQFWVGGHNNRYQACRATAQALNGATVLGSLATTATWEGATVKFTFVAASTTTTVKLTETYDDWSNEYYFDDFVVARAPKMTLLYKDMTSVFWRYGSNVTAQVVTYGQTYLSNDPTTPNALLVYTSDNQTLQLNLSSLNEVRLCDRAQRFIRLRQQVDLEFHELDWLVLNANRAIHATRPLYLDTPVLGAIAEFTRLSATYGISFDEFGCFIGDMNTYARKSEQSLYQRLFTSAIDGITLALDATLNFTASAGSKEAAIICSALQVTADELQQMAQLAFGADKMSAVTMSSARYAQLYRLAMIPRMLGLSFTAANQLWELLNPGKNTALRVAGGPTLETLAIIRQTEVVLTWMVDNQLDISTVVSMTSNVYSSAFTPEIQNFTYNLYTALITDTAATAATGKQGSNALDPAFKQKLCQAISPMFKST